MAIRNIAVKISDVIISMKFEPQLNFSTKSYRILKPKNMPPIVKFSMGEVTCNSSPERCGYYVEGNCLVKLKNGGEVKPHHLNKNSVTIFASCGMTSSELSGSHIPLPDPDNRNSEAKRT